MKYQQCLYTDIKWQSVHHAKHAVDMLSYLSEVIGIGEWYSAMQTNQYRRQKSFAGADATSIFVVCPEESAVYAD